MSKSDGGATVNAGGSVAYTINYSNAGLANATGVVLTEFLPVGSTFNAAGSTPGWTAVGSSGFQFMVGNLAAGANGSVVFAVTVPTPVPAALEQLSNTVIIADDGTHGADANPANNSASDTTPINAGPDLAVTKTDGGVSTLPGGIVLYQINYSNVGTQNDDSVVLTENLPANTTFNSTYSSAAWDSEGSGLFTLSVGNLPVGGSGTVVFAVNVASPLPGGVTQIANTVSIGDGGDSGPDLNPANNTATDSTPIASNPQADLQITKTDNVTTITPGSVDTYTITVTNAGPNAVTGASFTDNVPASLSGVTYTTSVSGGATVTPGSGSGNNISGSLNVPVGGTVIYTVSGTLDPNATGTLTNIATVLPPAGVTDPNTGNNTAIDQDTIVPVSDLAMTKSFTYTDLDGSGTVTPGDQIVFALTVTNNGPNAAHNVSVLDLLPNGYQFVSDDAALNGDTYSVGTGLWTIGTISATAPNNTAVLHITAIVGPGGTYTNSASIDTSDSSDPNAGNNSSSVTPPVQPKSDLSLAKTMALTKDNFGTGVISIGDQVTFTLTLNNAGPNDAASVHVKDLLPAGYAFVSATPSQGTYTSGTGDWNVGTVSVLSAPTLSIVATVVGRKPDSAYTNYAQVSASGSFDPDSTPGNNSTTEDDNASVTPFIADLSVTKTAALVGDNDASGTLTVGDDVAFTVTVANAGPDFATGVQLVDLLAAGYTYVTDDSPGTYDPTTGLWNVGVLAPGETATLIILAATNASGPYGNTAQVTASQQFDPDSTPNNNVPTEDDQASITLAPGAASLPPVAVKDSSLRNPPGPVTLNVTNNDSDPNFDLLVSTVDLDPTTAGIQTTKTVAGQGTWTVDSLGNVTFTPQPGFTHDPTPIAYTVQDATGKTSNQATISIDYLPDATDDKSIGNKAGTAVTVDVLANDTTGDLTIPTTVQIVGTPGAGSSLTVPDEGTWSVNTTTGAITFTPEPGFTGDPTPIQYTVNGAQGNVSNEATVTVDYAQFPPVAFDDSSLHNPPGPVTLNVTANDTDPNNDIKPSTVDLDPGTPGQQALRIVAGQGSGASRTARRQNGSAPFSPEVGFTHDPTPITYTVQGATGLTSNTATITIDYVPVATADSSLDNTLGTNATVPVLANDITGDTAVPTTVRIVAPPPGSTLSPDGKTLTVPGQGTWTVNPTTGAITFNPAPGFIGNPTPIQYTVQDAQGNFSNAATVIVGYVFSDVSIVKTANVVSVVPGQDNTVVYTIVVLNSGPSAAIGVPVNDTFPSAVTFATWTTSITPGSSSANPTGTGNITDTVTLLPGGSVIYFVAAIVHPDPSATGTVDNTATVTWNLAQGDTTPANDSSTFSLNLTPRNEISVTKDDGVTTAIPGTSTTYTITVHNNGPSTATNVSVSDPLPAGVASFTWSGNGQTNVGGPLSDIIASLAPGADVVYTIVAAIDGSATGSLANTVTVSAANDLIAANNSATDTDTLTPQADLSIAKSDGNADEVPGTNVTYLITVTNNGPSTVTGAAVSDGLPVGTTFVSATNGATYNAGTNTVTFTTGTLASGANTSFQLALAISPTLTGSLSNTATVSPPAGVTDPNGGNNSATDSDTLTPEADLSIAKSDGATSAVPGTNATYTITVTNNGPSTITGATVSDVLPAGTTFFSATNGATYDSGTNTVRFTTGTLAAGGTASFQLTLAIDSGLTGSLSNTATVAPPLGVIDPNGGNDSATDTDTLTPQADLSITKTDGQTSAVPGTNITYTVVVTNNGPSAVVDAVVTDILPPGATFVSVTGPAAYDAGASTVRSTTVTLAPGESVTYLVTVAIDPNLTGSLSNTATVSPPSGVTDPNPGNNSATDTDTLTPQADLSIAKSDGKTSVVPGTNNTYTITVTNNGPSSVTGATVSDVLPTGVTFVSATGGATYDAGTNTVHFTAGILAPGGATSFQLTVAVSASATGTLSNTATVSPPAGVTDPDGTNNSATDTDNLTPEADLSIFKSDGKDNVVAGTNTTYTITVTNNGPSTVTGATVRDVLPAGTTFVSAPGGTYDVGTNTVTFTTGTLAPGGTTNFQLTLAIDPGLTTPLVNTATVAPPAGVTDPVTGNNSSTDTDALTLQADLSITKTDGKSSAVPGTNTTYTITVTNNGPSTVTGAVVSDPLPAGTTFVLATNGATYDAGSNTVSFTTGTLAPGAFVSFDLTLAISPTATGSVSNTATVSPPSGVTDPTGGNNSATDTDTLTPQADLSITKSDFVTRNVPKTNEVPGTNVTYLITVTNNGPSTVTGATVSDPLPAGTTFVSATGGATYDAGTNTVHFTTGILATGDSTSFLVTLAIDPTLTGPTLSNTATVAPPAGVTDPIGGNNSATDTDTLTPTADLSIVKTDGTDTVVPGTNDTYTITVTNNGPSTITGAIVTDPLPACLTFVSATNGATFDGVAVHFTTGTLAAGESSSFDLTVSIDNELRRQQHRHRGAAGRRHRPRSQQQHLDGHRHGDAAIRPVHHQERRLNDRGAGNEHHVHHHRDQRRPQHRDGRHRRGPVACGSHLRLGHERRHLRCRHQHRPLHDRHARRRRFNQLPAHCGHRPDPDGILDQHGHRQPAGRRHRSGPEQQQRPRYGHADAHGRSEDHQERRQDQRRAGDKHHLHHHRDQPRRQHHHRGQGQRRLAHGHDVCFGDERRHLLTESRSISRRARWPRAT